ncbi:hypothetical protein B0H94_1049 [Salsuginibacillus halophilus]|uniref:Uncharacterized protein n=1 Tax=Salsuginibacillus halophilus TaxID=517424 RepID=A0A2P8HQC2_9BACI|nr:hypothetical protein [Salsuginibacillus halophilus]PSL48409.1 hypothetical protein B0H94_1049 [Salsuginibacillus halophilus]
MGKFYKKTSAAVLLSALVAGAATSAATAENNAGLTELAFEVDGDILTTDVQSYARAYGNQEQSDLYDAISSEDGSVYISAVKIDDRFIDFNDYASGHAEYEANLNDIYDNTPAVNTDDFKPVELDDDSDSSDDVEVPEESETLTFLEDIEYEPFNNLKTTEKRTEISALFFANHENESFENNSEIEKAIDEVIEEHNDLLEDFNNNNRLTETAASAEKVRSAFLNTDYLKNELSLFIAPFQTDAYNLGEESLNTFAELEHEEIASTLQGSVTSVSEDFSAEDGGKIEVDGKTIEVLEDNVYASIFELPWEEFQDVEIFVSVSHDGSFVDTDPNIMFTDDISAEKLSSLIHELNEYIAYDLIGLHGGGHRVTGDTLKVDFGQVYFRDFTFENSSIEDGEELGILDFNDVTFHNNNKFQLLLENVSSVFISDILIPESTHLQILEPHFALDTVNEEDQGIYATDEEAVEYLNQANDGEVTAIYR